MYAIHQVVVTTCYVTLGLWGGELIIIGVVVVWFKNIYVLLG